MLFGISEKAAQRLNKILDIVDASPPYIIGGLVVLVLVWMVGKV